MIEIPTSRFPGLRPLFPTTGHSRAIIGAALSGSSPARAFVDEPGSPHSVLLQVEGAFFYVAGEARNATFSRALVPLIFDQLLPELAEPELVLFAFTDAWRVVLDERLAEKGAIRIARKVFDFDLDRFTACLRTLPALPEGLRIVRIERSLAARYPDFLPLVDRQTGRFGVCLLAGEQRLSSCSAVFVGDGEAEVDIQTDERWRGRGYARLTAAAFIQECLARTLTPNWACWPERAASIALAKGLGFIEKPDVPAHLWSPEL